ncbi:LysE family transporter [Enterobacter hormaechei]
MANDWLELRQHAETGIETIKAHFEGHAFDPHWHDSYLVGITLSGTQQFHCRRERHRSQPGDAFLLEPGEIHDGDAPVEGGFTYLTFYLDEHWLTRTLQGLYDSTPGSYTLHFAQTLTREPQLVRAIGDTFASLHNDEMKIVQQSTMDNLLSQITAHCHWRKKLPSQLQSSAVAHRARDYLYAHIGENVGLSDLARETGTDRFTLTRCFKREFHLAPHAWLSGAGAGEVLRQYPLIRQVMSWAGVLWLSWMSWQLFSAPAANLSSRRHVRFTARAAALLQVVNPKTWMMALAVVSLFAPASDHALRDITLMALWFLAISVVCLLCWAWLGKAVNRIFRTTVAMVRFQRAMALCLFISAWTGMLA